MFFHVICGFFFLCLMAKTDEVGVWGAGSPPHGWELTWNTTISVFAESKRKSWCLSNRSFGAISNSVLYQSKSNRNLEIHPFSVPPAFIHSCGFTCLQFKCITFLSLFIVHDILVILSNIKINSCFRPTWILTYQILLQTLFKSCFQPKIPSSTYHIILHLLLQNC